jgi:hypothetical protein
MTDVPDSVVNRRDTEHLKVLGILYYVWSGLCLLGVVFGIVYVAVIPQPIHNPYDAAEVASAHAADPIIYGVGTAIIVGSFLAGLLYFMTARGLLSGRYRGLVYLAAILTLFSFPLGTLLGIFTLVVMNRPTVKARFQAP